MKRIIAYFLHESELAEITTAIKTPKKSTDSYVIADADDQAIEALKKKGIVFKFLEKKDPAPSLAANAEKMISNLKAKAGLEGLTLTAITDHAFDLRPTFKPDYPAYFIIYMSEPLITDNKKILDELGVKIIRSLGDDNYVGLLDEKNSEAIKKLDFVEYVEYYGSTETIVPANPSLRIKPLLPDESASIAETGKKHVELKTSLFDILLHSGEDLHKLLSWLKENGFQIVGNSTSKVRIQVNPEQNGNMIKLASNKYVESVEKYVPPKTTNDVSREILNIDSFGASTSTPVPQLEFEGAGQLIGVADTGIDDSHPAFNGRIRKIMALGRQNDHSDPVGHGTHVTGSIVGTGGGSNGAIRGVAPRAQVFFQSLLTSDGRLNLPIDIRELFQQAYDEGARVHNNSWGAATKSRYTANSNEVDDFVHKHPDMLLVFSAGNDGKGSNNKNVAKGYTDLLSLGSPATAKNALTVGASRNKRSEGGYSRLAYGTVWPQSFPDPPTQTATVSGDVNSMAAFSSRGPVDDSWRIKPDLVAPGTDIASAFSKDADLSEFCGIHPQYDQYALLCGTSMSAPLITGCAALVREYYTMKANHPNPSAALLKATLINSCRLLTGPDGTLNNTNTPHFHQGFGIVDMLNSVPNKTKSFNLIFKDTLSDETFRIERNGQKIKFKLTLGSKGWISACLVYTDYPGRGLQNNLLLFADHQVTSTKWIGNDFMPKLLNVIEPTYNVSIDLSNNVQAVKIQNAEPGDYTIQVIAHNAWMLPQDYALVVTTHDMTSQLIHLNNI